MKIKLLVLSMAMMGCGGTGFEPEGTGSVKVLPLCGACFRVFDQLCVDDGTCPGSACATERPDLQSMAWVNDPGLNWLVDFNCE